MSPILRRGLFLAALLPALTILGPAASRADDDDKGFVSLFNGKNLDGLKTILQNGKGTMARSFPSRKKPSLSWEIPMATSIPTRATRIMF